MQVPYLLASLSLAPVLGGFWALHFLVWFCLFLDLIFILILFCFWTVPSSAPGSAQEITPGRFKEYQTQDNHVQGKRLPDMLWPHGPLLSLKVLLHL